jgi:hypothetical protein
MRFLSVTVDYEWFLFELESNNSNSVIRGIKGAKDAISAYYIVMGIAMVVMSFHYFDVYSWIQNLIRIPVY